MCPLSLLPSVCCWIYRRCAQVSSFRKESLIHRESLPEPRQFLGERNLLTNTTTLVVQFQKKAQAENKAAISFIMSQQLQIENLAPRTQHECDVGVYFTHRSPAKIALGRIRTRLTNLTHFNDECSHSSISARAIASPFTSEKELFQTKMQVLLKNPSIFREFKAYLFENEMSHSKEGMCR